MGVGSGVRGLRVELVYLFEPEESLLREKSTDGDAGSWGGVLVQPCYFHDLGHITEASFFFHKSRLSLSLRSGLVA